jgi:hypothetical protein
MIIPMIILGDFNYQAASYTSFHHHTFPIANTHSTFPEIMA